MNKRILLLPLIAWTLLMPMPGHAQAAPQQPIDPAARMRAGGVQVSDAQPADAGGERRRAPAADSSAPTPPTERPPADPSQRRRAAVPPP